MYNTWTWETEAWDGPANGKMSMCHDWSTAGEAYSYGDALKVTCSKVNTDRMLRKRKRGQI